MIAPVVLRTAEGLLAVSAATTILYSLHLNLATTGFLLLPLVLVVAMRGGVWAATWVSVFANLCLDYFFTPPLFHFSVDDPQNWFSLLAFEISAILVSHLSTRLAVQKAVAHRNREELQDLYSLSRKLLMLQHDETTLTKIAAAVKDATRARAVALFDVRANAASAVGTGDPLLESEVRGACLLKEDIRSSSPDTVIRVLHMGPQMLGAIGIRGIHMKANAADATADLVAVALERTRA